jgi:hypothetical protein
MPDYKNIFSSPEVISSLFDIISHLSETEKRELLEVLEKRQSSKFMVKREHSRKHSKIPVEFSIDDFPFTHFTQNVSKSGAFIETDLPFQKNQELSMAFAFPSDEDPIKTKGKIVRTDSEGIAVKFLKPIPDTYDDLLLYFDTQEESLLP